MIHKDCIERILKTQTTPPNLVTLFNRIATEAEKQGLPSATVASLYYDEDCNLQPGDWAAELHLVVRKVADEYENDPDEDEVYPGGPSHGDPGTRGGGSHGDPGVYKIKPRGGFYDDPDYPGFNGPAVQSDPDEGGPDDAEASASDLLPGERGVDEVQQEDVG
jgi:hypothetical protein